MLNQFTNKRGLIVYGGESSANYGMVVAEAPAFERATRKQTTYKVPGRNGAVIIQQDAWEDVTRNYRVWIVDSSSKGLVEYVDAFEAWLNSQTGYQRLEDSFEPDVYRLAYYSGGTSVSNMLMQAGEAEISFVCRPERFYKSGEQEQQLTNGVPIYNPTRYQSKPLIYIAGAGEVSLAIGSKTITATIEDYIFIDCETMNAYREPTENKNNSITGPFPVIDPGVNAISITGAVTSATVVPRYFTI